MGKKILCITPGTCGGAERMVLLYAKILSKSGLNVQLVIHKDFRLEFDIKAFVPKQLRTYYVSSYGRLTYLLVLLRVLFLKPDVIFTPFGGSAWFLLMMKEYGLVKSKIIVREMNMPNTHPENFLLNNIRFAKSASLCIAQTQEMKDLMLEYYGLKEENVVVINNPTDKELIKEKIKESFIFDKTYVNYVAVGRVVAQKDHLTMLRAFNLVHQKNNKTRLYIVGKIVSNSPKACYNELEQYVKQHSLEDCVFFEGFQSNPYKYVINADVFLLSSIREGMPNAMLEAMYLGRPVVATRCIPYISQVIHEGVNGYTCEVGDYRSFADCIIKASRITDLPLLEEVNNTDDKIVEVFSSVLN